MRSPDGARGWLRLALTGAALIGALALAGCRTTATVGTSTSLATTTTTTTSSPPEAAVTVAAASASVAVGRPIGVSVHNRMTAPIYALDTRSGCTILELQVEAQGAWSTAMAARCAMGRPAHMVRVDAGAVYTTSISANTFGVATPLAPGTYRLALTYQLTPTLDGASATAAMPVTIYSPTFTVVGATGAGIGDQMGA